MIVRENEIGKSNIRLKKHDIALASSMIDKMSTTIDLLYYLIDRGEERSFVIMLISADDVDMQDIINSQKRDTDILFYLEHTGSLYALICQDTKVDGAYMFAQRLVKKVQDEGANNIYCAELEVKSAKHDIKYIIFRSIETYVDAVQNKKDSEIVFKTIN